MTASCPTWFHTLTGNPSLMCGNSGENIPTEGTLRSSRIKLWVSTDGQTQRSNINKTTLILTIGISRVCSVRARRALELIKVLCSAGRIPET